jgi:acetyl-CoA carboxylase carboxyltransferase component
MPLIYLQDVSGFMVGPDAERAGIIRAGAEMVETMSCATVPKIILTLNHASGAGYYAMAGQGFDPNFTFSWPTARIGVMEGESAVMAVHGAELEKAKTQTAAVVAEKDPSVPQEGLVVHSGEDTCDASNKAIPAKKRKGTKKQYPVGPRPLTRQARAQGRVSK